MKIFQEMAEKRWFELNMTWRMTFTGSWPEGLKIIIFKWILNSPSHISEVVKYNLIYLLFIIISTSLSKMKNEVVIPVYYLVLEPIGSTPPRLPPKSKLDAVVAILNRATVLPCDAQANPIPFFRWGIKQSYRFLV